VTTPLRVPLRHPAEPLEGFARLLPVRLVTGAALAADPLFTNTSGDFAALSEADGFVERPPAGTPTPEHLSFYPLTPFPAHGGPS
jgi:hypothetical protein